MGLQITDRLKKQSSPLYRRLLREFEDRVRIHPHYADLHNQFGLLFAQSEDWPAAEKHFKEALRLNPKYREASLNLGYLYLEMKQWDQAEHLLVPESRRHPGDSSLHHVLAVSFLNMGRDTKASLHFRKAASHPYYLDLYRKKGAWKKGSISLDPKARQALMTLRINYQRAHFHNFVGLYLAKEGRAAQAIRELRKAAMLKPDEFLFHANLGTVYYHQGAFGKAVEEYREAVKMDPRNGMGYACLSYAYGLMRRNGQALRAMEKAAQLCPRYADLRYNLALLYSDRRRYGEAVAELKKALRINPNYLFARINLGVLYEDMGRWKEAIRTYEKILQITPEDEHIRRRLEGALKRQHRPG